MHAYWNLLVLLWLAKPLLPVNTAVRYRCFSRSTLFPHIYYRLGCFTLRPTVKKSPIFRSYSIELFSFLEMQPPRFHLYRHKSLLHVTPMPVANGIPATPVMGFHTSHRDLAKSRIQGSELHVTALIFMSIAVGPSTTQKVRIAAPPRIDQLLPVVSCL